MVLGVSGGLHTRKGNVMNIFMIVIVVFALAFVTLISTVVLTEFRDVNIDKGLGLDATLIDKGLVSLSSLDYMFIFATVGLGAATVVMAFQYKTHPILFAFMLLMLGFMVIFTTFFTNMYGVITEQTGVVAIVGDFPLIDYAMRNLPLIMAGIGLFALLVMFMNKKSDVGM